MEDSELHFLLFPSLSAPSLVHYITLHFRLTNPVLLTPSASCPCSGTPDDSSSAGEWTVVQPIRALRGATRPAQLEQKDSFLRT